MVEGVEHYGIGLVACLGDGLFLGLADLDPQALGSREVGQRDIGILGIGQARVDGEWANQYAFNLSPQEWVDFAPANYLNSTHPDAIFVQKRVVVLHQPAGRMILVGDALKTITASGTETRQLAPDEIQHVLGSLFGLATERQAAAVC